MCTFAGLSAYWGTAWKSTIRKITVLEPRGVIVVIRRRRPLGRSETSHGAGVAGGLLPASWPLGGRIRDGCSVPTLQVSWFLNVCCALCGVTAGAFKPDWGPILALGLHPDKTRRSQPSNQAGGRQLSHVALEPRAPWTILLGIFHSGSLI